MARYRAAVVGCGNRADAHARAFIEVGETDLAAVVDLDRPRADAFAKEYGCAAYCDAGEMLEKARPDFVCLATREHPRHALTVQCAEAGVKAIIAEKPMARTLDQAHDMVEVCEKRDVLLIVSHQMRFCSEFVAAREALPARFDLGPHVLDTRNLPDRLPHTVRITQ